MLEAKDADALGARVAFLPVPLTEQAWSSGSPEVSAARVHEGKRTRRETAKTRFLSLSRRIDERSGSIRNGGGWNVLVNTQREAQKEKPEAPPADPCFSLGHKPTGRATRYT